MSPAKTLTPEEKARILSEWNAKASAPLPAGPLGGRGYPDPAMIPWCEAINAIAGVCTVQSCAGHAESDGALTSGVVWLRLSDPLVLAFRTRAFDLAADRAHFDRVSTIFLPGNDEIYAVEFAGNERGLLDESMQALLSVRRAWRAAP